MNVFPSLPVRRETVGMHPLSSAVTTFTTGC